MSNVPQHQDPLQLRSAGQYGRNSSRVIAVRKKDQWLQQAVEGQRGVVRGRGRRNCSSLGSSPPIARDECATEESRGRSRQGESSRRREIWSLSLTIALVADFPAD